MYLSLDVSISLDDYGKDDGLGLCNLGLSTWKLFCIEDLYCGKFLKQHLCILYVFCQFVQQNFICRSGLCFLYILAIVGL